MIRSDSRVPSGSRSLTVSKRCCETEPVPPGSKPDSPWNYQSTQDSAGRIWLRPGLAGSVAADTSSLKSVGLDDQTEQCGGVRIRSTNVRPGFWVVASNNSLLPGRDSRSTAVCRIRPHPKREAWRTMRCQMIEDERARRFRDRRAGVGSLECRKTASTAWSGRRSMVSSVRAFPRDCPPARLRRRICRGDRD